MERRYRAPRPIRLDHVRKLWLLLLAVTALGVAAPSVASADATLSREGGELRYESGSQVGEDLTIIKRTTANQCAPVATPCIQFANSKVITDDADGCEPVTNIVVACAPTGVTNILLTLNDGNDTARAADNLPPTKMNGGTGDDSLASFNGADTLMGGPGEDDLVDFEDSGAGDVIDGGADDDTIRLGDGDDDVLGGAGADAVELATGDDTVHLDDLANDGATGESKNIHTDIEVIDGGGGGDTLFGNALANTLVGGLGNDVLEGGGGPDVLEGQGGADDLAGGPDVDRVVYSGQEGQTITLDDVRNDGAPSELDNVHSDIEDVAAGPGNDQVTGSALANVLDGGDGNDRLEGRGGVDTFAGGSGSDELLAGDGAPERVDCGPEADAGVADTIDLPVDCEGVLLSAELVADADGDGATKPSDCDDGNPAIHPGAVDLPENGIDEDCSLADAANLDHDADGFLLGSDCDDANAAVHPGAVDIPVNGIDEDCVGADAAFPVLRAAVTFRFTVFATFTRLDRYGVVQLAGGETIKLRCKGRGCPFKLKQVEAPRAGARDLIKLVRKARFRARTVLEAFVSKPGAVGRYRKLTFRAAKPPLLLKRCLQPGARTPSACPPGA